MKLKSLAAATLLGVTAACATVPPIGPLASPLIGREWTVVDVSGRATLPDARPTLLFTPDGRLAGSTSCNRLIGSYAVGGNRIKVTPAGTTLMACPPAVMEQERDFLNVVRGVRSYRFGPSGELVLMSRSGATLRAL